MLERRHQTEQNEREIYEKFTKMRDARLVVYKPRNAITPRILYQCFPSPDRQISGIRVPFFVLVRLMPLCYTAHQHRDAVLEPDRVQLQAL